MLIVTALFLAQVFKDVFHHHHGAIHQHADGHGQATQRHQVGGHAQAGHRQQGQANGKRNGQQNQGRGTQVHQEQGQHDDDKDEGQQQGGDHCADGFFHQICLVVEHLKLHTVRQGLLDARFAFLDAIDGGLCIGAHAFEHDAGYHFAEGFRFAAGITAGHGEGALSNFAAELHLGHITDAHLGAVHFLEGNGGNVTEPLLAAADPAHAADDQLLGTAIQIPAAGVAVIGGDGIHDLLQAQVVGQQTGRVHVDLILAHFTAIAEHIGDAAHGHE